MLILNFKTLKGFAFAAILSAGSSSQAAQGEMGAGIPVFGSYSAAVGVPHTRIWSLTNSTQPFPAGCSTIALVSSTMGMDSYKIAVATLLTAKATGKRVRFYAHAVRDDGCGVDYVELQD